VTRDKTAEAFVIIIIKFYVNLEKAYSLWRKEKKDTFRLLRKKRCVNEEKKRPLADKFTLLNQRNTEVRFFLPVQQ